MEKTRIIKVMSCKPRGFLRQGLPLRIHLSGAGIGLKTGQIPNTMIFMILLNFIHLNILLFPI